VGQEVFSNGLVAVEWRVSKFDEDGDSTMDFMNPCSVFKVESAPLTPRVSLSEKTTIGLFANDKRNADVLLEHVQRRLKVDHGIEKFLWFRKEASQPANFTEAFTTGCDAVVAAVCD
jgi:hypothetical protein